MPDAFPQRKPTRWKDFDYSSAGAYFVTVCTEGRRPVLSHLVGGDVLDAPKRMELLPYGRIAEKYLLQLNAFYTDIQIDQYVIMPNHIHIMLCVRKSGASRTSPPTRQHAAVSQFISTFKRFCNKEYGENIWQARYYDHVIRNQQDYNEIWKYIENNPTKWAITKSKI